MPRRVVTGAIPFLELIVAGPWDSSTKTGNFDTSRALIDRIIIHTMDGTWQAAAARFANLTACVSAHYGVREDGGLIHWLEEYYTAYHAGNYAMNQRSIGIEHEDKGDYNGVRPDALYETSAKLVADICSFYGIPCDRHHILKHSEVDLSPTACPDALDIDRIVREANAILSPPPPPPAPSIPATTYTHTDPSSGQVTGVITVTPRSTPAPQPQPTVTVTTTTYPVPTTIGNPPIAPDKPVSPILPSIPSPIPPTDRFIILAWLQRFIAWLNRTFINL